MSQRKKKPIQYYFVDINDPDYYKRIKVGRACNDCRKRKSKCDIGKPNSGPCSNCKKHGRLCEFTATTKTKTATITTTTTTTTTTNSNNNRNKNININMNIINNNNNNTIWMTPEVQIIHNEKEKINLSNFVTPISSTSTANVEYNWIPHQFTFLPFSVPIEEDDDDEEKGSTFIINTPNNNNNNNSMTTHHYFNNNNNINDQQQQQQQQYDSMNYSSNNNDFDMMIHEDDFDFDFDFSTYNLSNNSNNNNNNKCIISSSSQPSSSQPLSSVSSNVTREVQHLVGQLCFDLPIVCVEQQEQNQLKNAQQSAPFSNQQQYGIIVTPPLPSSSMHINNNHHNHNTNNQNNNNNNNTNNYNIYNYNNNNNNSNNNTNNNNNNNPTDSFMYLIKLNSSHPLINEKEEIINTLEETLFDIYFQHIHPSYPVLPKHIFQQHRSLPPSIRFAMIAVSCLYYDEHKHECNNNNNNNNNNSLPSSFNILDIANSYYKKAWLILQSRQGNDLISVQTLLLLYKYHITKGEASNVDHYLDMAQLILDQCYHHFRQQQVQTSISSSSSSSLSSSSSTSSTISSPSSTLTTTNSSSLSSSSSSSSINQLDEWICRSQWILYLNKFSSSTTSSTLKTKITTTTTTTTKTITLPSSSLLPSFNNNNDNNNKNDDNDNDNNTQLSKNNNNSSYQHHHHSLKGPPIIRLPCILQSEQQDAVQVKIISQLLEAIRMACVYASSMQSLAISVVDPFIQHSKSEQSTTTTTTTTTTTATTNL